MNFGIPDEAVARICGVVSAHTSIEQVCVYGSRAKGNWREGSDIDLVMYGLPDKDEYSRIAVELDDLMLPWKIDLSYYSTIDNPALLEHIDRVGQVLYKRNKVQD